MSSSRDSSGSSGPTSARYQGTPAPADTPARTYGSNSSRGAQAQYRNNAAARAVAAEPSPAAAAANADAQSRAAARAAQPAQQGHQKDRGITFTPGTGYGNEMQGDDRVKALQTYDSQSRQWKAIEAAGYDPVEFITQQDNMVATAYKRGNKELTRELAKIHMGQSQGVNGVNEAMSVGDEHLAQTLGMDQAGVREYFGVTDDMIGTNDHRGVMRNIMGEEKKDFGNNYGGGTSSPEYKAANPVNNRPANDPKRPRAPLHAYKAAANAVRAQIAKKPNSESLKAQLVELEAGIAGYGPGQDRASPTQNGANYSRGGITRFETPAALAGDTGQQRNYQPAATATMGQHHGTRAPRAATMAQPDGTRAPRAPAGGVNSSRRDTPQERLVRRGRTRPGGRGRGRERGRRASTAVRIEDGMGNSGGGLG